jgi:hypothetical protein
MFHPDKFTSPSRTPYYLQRGHNGTIWEYSFRFSLQVMSELRLMHLQMIDALSQPMLHDTFGGFGNVTILILYYTRGFYGLSSTLTLIPLAALHSLFLSLVLF